MTALQARLARACTELGLRLALDFVASLPSGRRVLALARIAELGGTNGMLIVTRYDDVRPVLDEIDAAGFGFSVLSEPTRDEGYDLQPFIEMFSEWSWTGSEDARPSWMVTRHEVAAFVCTHVWNDHAPILHVAVEHGDWMFLCGGFHDETDGGPIVLGRNHVVDRDPTVAEVLDLPDHWEAVRSAAGEAWVREPSRD